MKIGLLSETHSIIDKRILKFFENCDEIWHAGDIGTIKTLESLEKFKKIRAVYGNIDNHQIRKEVNEFLLLKYEKLVILIIHIAGKPPKYNKITYNLIKKHKPNILICGHSHILKIHRDKENDILIINPGASGNVGFHKFKTAIRFNIINSNIKKLEIIELKRN
jgi:putative phosphoesterase|tara:strand:- start:957 stop:1448 length:492 start_codon:yes stop_codon:yes gene_type:complete